MKIKNKELETPILFIIFNRPDTTQKVFDEIKKSKPLKLFIAADGPRNSYLEDAEKCELTRKIINQVDWDCEVNTLFQEKNLGCKIAVSTAINWFFDHVEQGIILEDDCLPSQSFFFFCEYLLDYYKDDKRIMQIGGSNFKLDSHKDKYSYYFSRHAYIWGWATWKRAWKLYDINITTFSDFKENNQIKNIFDSKKEQDFWLKKFQEVYDNKINTWDYQWYYSILINNSLCIVPNVNLVINIGFGLDSTHTGNKNEKIEKMKINEIDTLLHPKFIIQDKKADKYTFDKVYYPNLFYRIKNKIARLFK